MKHMHEPDRVTSVKKGNVHGMSRISFQGQKRPEPCFLVVGAMKNYQQQA